MNKDIDEDDSARCKSKPLRWTTNWCPREFPGKGSPHFLWPNYGQNSQHIAVRRWDEWEELQKPLIFFGGCNFRKDKNLGFVEPRFGTARAKHLAGLTMSSSQDLLDRASVLITTHITRRELVRCDKLVTTPYPN